MSRKGRSPLLFFVCGFLSREFLCFVEVDRVTILIPTCFQVQQFFVVNFPGKTASQLYSDVLAHIAQVYVYPVRVTDKAEKRSIIINGSEPEFMELTGRLGCLYLRYRIEIQFKDGRLRINMPEITVSHVLLYRFGLAAKLEKEFAGIIVALSERQFQ